MANYPKIREQHIAVFGESGSGKTVLASSFYGPTQEKSFSNGLWDLVADDTGLGNRLYKNYVGMRDHATAPAPTRFAGATYAFSVKLKRGGNAKAKKPPFDVLRLAWHDYPGEWFEESPGSEEEANRRIDTLRSLLRSDVALVLVDGQRLLDCKGQEERYLKSLLTNFRQGLLQLKEDLLAGEGPAGRVPAHLDHRTVEG
jgi:ABC-type dipeptide/oligopeptide/nickel transport system ATPase component